MSKQSKSIVCIVGRTGSGKSVLAKALQATGRFEETVSITTREPRPGEEDGVHYQFVSEDDFKRIEGENGLIESAKFSGCYYGTTESEVERIAREGKTTIMVVEPQGASNIGKWAKESGCEFTSVFIDCDERLSTTRMVSRLLDDARLNENAPLNIKQDLVDRYSERLANIVGFESSWRALIPYDLVLSTQTSQEDTAVSIKAIEAAVLESAGEKAEFDPKSGFDHLLASDALVKGSGIALTRIRNILEAVLLLGEPLPDEETLADWILYPQCLPKVDAETLIDMCISGDPQGVWNTMTNHGNHSMSEGVVAIMAPHPYSKIDRIIQDEARLRVFIDGTKCLHQPTPNILFMREPGSQHSILESLYKMHKSTLCRVLVEGGLPVNSAVNATGETLLHLATRNENQQWITSLLDCGADIEHCDYQGETPYELATRWKVEATLSQAIKEREQDSLAETYPF